MIQQKKDIYKNSLKFIGWVQLVGVLGSIGFLIFLWVLSRSTEASGIEFFSLLLVPFIIGLGAIALVNLIALPIWLAKRRPENKLWWGLSLLLSILLAAYGAYMVYQFAVIIPREVDKRTSEIRDRTSEATPNRTSYTVDDAKIALQECKIDYFSGYNGNISLVHENLNSWIKTAESSLTGVEMILNENENTYLFASASTTEELLHEARQARQKCYDKKKLHIYVDNWQEVEYPIGTWVKVYQ